MNYTAPHERIDEVERSLLYLFVDSAEVFSHHPKKEQLDAVQPDAIFSACSNCRIHLEDGLEEYNMDIPLLSLTEIIAEHLTEN